MDEQFVQYMTTIFRNGKCFRDVYSEREEEIARHAWEWSRKALKLEETPSTSSPVPV